MLVYSAKSWNFAKNPEKLYNDFVFLIHCATQMQLAYVWICHHIGVQHLCTPCYVMTFTFHVYKHR